jgi:hypothetical protein
MLNAKTAREGQYLCCVARGLGVSSQVRICARACRGLEMVLQIGLLRALRAPSHALEGQRSLHSVAQSSLPIIDVLVITINW